MKSMKGWNKRTTRQ